MSASTITPSTKAIEPHSLGTFRREYHIWLAGRTKLLTEEELPDDIGHSLFEDNLHRGKSLLTMFVNEPDREWVACKLEIARALLGPTSDGWVDQRSWMILGALEADLMMAVGELEAIAETKAWAALKKANQADSVSGKTGSSF